MKSTISAPEGNSLGSGFRAHHEHAARESRRRRGALQSLSTGWKSVRGVIHIHIHIQDGTSRVGSVAAATAAAVAATAAAVVVAADGVAAGHGLHAAGLHGHAAGGAAGGAALHGAAAHRPLAGLGAAIAAHGVTSTAAAASVGHLGVGSGGEAGRVRESLCFSLLGCPRG